MGFVRRVVRKSVRKATPRPVREAVHPARMVKDAVTPRPVKQGEPSGLHSPASGRCG